MMQLSDYLQLMPGLHAGLQIAQQQAENRRQKDLREQEAARMAQQRTHDAMMERYYNDIISERQAKRKDEEEKNNAFKAWSEKVNSDMAKDMPITKDIPTNDRPNMGYDMPAVPAAIRPQAEADPNVPSFGYSMPQRDASLGYAQAKPDIALPAITGSQTIETGRRPLTKEEAIDAYAASMAKNLSTAPQHMQEALFNTLSRYQSAAEQRKTQEAVAAARNDAMQEIAKIRAEGKSKAAEGVAITLPDGRKIHGVQTANGAFIPAPEPTPEVTQVIDKNGKPIKGVYLMPNGKIIREQRSPFDDIPLGGQEDSAPAAANASTVKRRKWNPETGKLE